MLSYLPISRDPCGTSRKPPRDAVVDVLRHLGDDEAGQIGVEPADQAGGDDGAGHQLVGRGWLLQGVRIVDLLLGAGFEEGELARLVGRVRRRPAASNRQLRARGRARRRVRLIASSASPSAETGAAAESARGAPSDRRRCAARCLQPGGGRTLGSRAPGRPCGRAVRVLDLPRRLESASRRPASASGCPAAASACVGLLSRRAGHRRWQAASTGRR